MKLRRAVVGALSSLVWPVVVLAIPVGITFAAARVYAESGAVLPDEPCDSSTYTSCADAAVLSACTSEACAGPGCACYGGAQCVGGSAPVSRCTRITTCSDLSANIAPCTGLDAGAPCVLPGSPSATCVEQDCAVNEDGSFVEEPRVLCSPTASNASTTTRDGAVDSFGAGTTGSPAETVHPKDDDSTDSGCDASPSTTSGTAVFFGAPLAIALLLARRRRRG